MSNRQAPLRRMGKLAPANGRHSAHDPMSCRAVVLPTVGGRVP